MSSQPITIQPGPGTTFGPAQDRVTRTPILPTDLGPNENGDFNNLPPILSALTNPSTIPSAIQNGVIRINPNRMLPSPDNVIRHEAIHQVLLKQLGGQIGISPTRDLETAGDQFGPLSTAVSQMGGGYMGDEVPAYVGSGDPRVDAPAAWKQQYIQQLYQNLQKLNPKLAAQFQKLSGGQVPAAPPPGQVAFSQ